MMERRRSTRIAGPFDGGWHGETGTRECRITDLGDGGCFIDSMTGSAVGSAVMVEFTLSGQQFQLSSEVVYLDRAQGFAVRFTDNPPEVMSALSRAIASRA